MLSCEYSLPSLLHNSFFTPLNYPFPKSKFVKEVYQMAKACDVILVNVQRK